MHINDIRMLGLSVFKNNIKNGERIQALDFTKGVLVILMIIYHSLNYLKYFFIAHKYMPFLTPSFIMISGFIVTNHYFSEFELDPRKISKRLFLRSIKLFLIFTFLNIIARIIWSENQHGISLGFKNFLNEWLSIYVIGTSGTVAFEVLLPIGYVLFLSIFLLKVQSRLPYFIVSCAIILSLSCVLIEMTKISIYNLTLISFGVIGMTIGLIHLASINSFLQKKIVFLSLFILYGFIFFYLPDKHYSQILLTLIVLSLIYSIGEKINLQFYLFKQVILFGKYSLFSYIFQILFIILFLGVLGKLKIAKPDILNLIILTLLSTWLVVYFLAYLRSKIKFINFFYKIVFA